MFSAGFAPGTAKAADRCHGARSTSDANTPAAFCRSLETRPNPPIFTSLCPHAQRSQAYKPARGPLYGYKRAMNPASGGMPIATGAPSQLLPKGFKIHDIAARRHDLLGSQRQGA